MYNYPFFNFPISSSSRFKSYNHSKYNNSYQNNLKNKYSKLPNEPVNSNTNNSHKNSSYFFDFFNNFFHQNDRSDNENYFEIFGLKLYNDDLLLLGLIFFLYKEQVEDQYLFFALILLLLS